jgi:ubiquinone/menaquinone biosynthesis C-methylase UbiE
MSLSATQPQVLPAPFDAVAAGYDETFTSSSIGRAQRAPVWSELAKAFHTGDRTLEIGCGTGVDACFLAERGVEVLACDPSSQMIEITARRVRQSGLQTLVRTRALRAEDISTLHPEELFDGAFSNFGALNCVPDLDGLARSLARLLKPGATLLLCWMGPCCLWEIAWYLGQGNKNKAFRRFQQNGVRANLADGAFVDVHYPSARSLARTFAPQFRLKSVRGVGIAVPPSYLELWAQRHPRLLRLCRSTDSWVARWPGIRVLGDHVLVRWQRTSADGRV